LQLIVADNQIINALKINAKYLGTNFSYIHPMNTKSFFLVAWFIIGSGGRTPELINTLIKTAELNKKNYIRVLPMSSPAADTTYYYIKADLEAASTNTIANLSFTKDKLNDSRWIEYLKKAKLIFITREIKSRFTRLVLHSPVQDAIRYNRLISALAKFPGYTYIGINEATAIIVQGNKVTVAGERQVVVLSDPQGLTIRNGLIKLNDMRFSIYTSVMYFS
jgi:cyanophycinase-like exopeptidase